MRNSRAINLLLFANSISGVAQGISMLAIPWYFTGVIHSETLYGKVFFAATCIAMFWGVYAGTLIDRYDRKKLFLVINLVGLAVVGSVTGLGFYHGELPWQSVAVVFACTMFIYNIHFPNLYAFAQEITPKEDYARITSLLEIQGQLTFTLAGGFSAVLLNGFDGHLVNLGGYDFTLPIHFRALKIYEVFAIDACTYIVAFAIIYRIKSLPVVERSIDTSVLSERLKTGIRFLKQKPLIFRFGNASLLVFLTILVFGLYVMPVYVDSYLQQGANVFAVGDMSFSLGALIAGFVTTRVFPEKAAVRGIIILSAIAGLMYGVILLSKIVLVFFAAQFITGICNAAVRILRITYLFHHIPNDIIGRANSVLFMLNVFFRVCLIGLFTLPYFHNGTQILAAVGTLGIICVAASIILGVYYEQLLAAPETDK